MDYINLNKYSNRNIIYNEIKDILLKYENKLNDILVKKNICLYGPPGCGKTYFINNIVKELNYSSIIYNSCEIRNKCINKIINNHNFSNIDNMYYKNNNLFNNKKKI